MSKIEMPSQASIVYFETPQTQVSGTSTKDPLRNYYADLSAVYRINGYLVVVREGDCPNCNGVGSVLYRCEDECEVCGGTGKASPDNPRPLPSEGIGE